MTRSHSLLNNNFISRKSWDSFQYTRYCFCFYSVSLGIKRTGENLAFQFNRNFLYPLVEGLLPWLPIRTLKPAELRFRVRLFKPAEPLKSAEVQILGSENNHFTSGFCCNSDIYYLQFHSLVPGLMYYGSGRNSRINTVSVHIGLKIHFLKLCSQ